MTTVAITRPGVRFVSETPRTDVLPRMDVAAFVGFATAGPIDLPVCIEDPSRFTAVFGDDITLPGFAGEPAEQGRLGGAVRAFLAGGGTRCWVSRAAEGGSTTRFPLAGFASIDGGGSSAATAAASLMARSPGSGFDAVETSSELEVAASTCTVAPTVDATSGLMQFVVSGAVTSAPEPGDLIRFADGGDVVTAPVRSVTNRASGSLAQAVLIELDQSKATRWKGGGTAGPVSVDLGAGRGSRAGELRVPPAAAGAECEVEITGLDGVHPIIGQVLAVTVDERVLLMSVVRVERPKIATADPLDVAVVAGPGMWFSFTNAEPAATPAAALAGPALTAKVERLRLTLTTRANGRRSTIRQLSLTAAHPRWAGALPGDELRHGGRQAIDGGPWSADWAREVDTETAPGRLALNRDAIAADMPAAGGTLSDAAMLVPIAGGAPAGTWLPAISGPDVPWVRDGVPSDPTAVLLDLSLKRTRVSALSGEAQHLRLEAELLRRLRGLHALLALEEATLLAVPDATYGAWEAVDRDTPEVLVEPTPEADPTGAFGTCASLLAAPELLAPRKRSGGRLELSWVMPSAPSGTSFELASKDRPDPSAPWTAVTTTSSTSHTMFVAEGLRWFRVRAHLGSQTGPWSAIQAADLRQAHQHVRTEVAAPYRSLLQVHRALLRLAAARGDALALLSLPASAREREAIAHARSLQELPPAGDPDLLADVPPIDDSEAQALGFGGLHHPWVISDAAGLPQSATATGTRATEPAMQPPDGAIAGLLANRARTDGAWTAAAGHRLPGALGLHPAFTAEAADRLDLAGVNTLRHTPRGFEALSQRTLDRDPDRQPINVRRLMALLVRLVRLRGPDYVFEPLGPTLRRAVQRGFSATLAGLHERGAFVGRTPGEAYRVDVPEQGENRLVVELRVAPSRPLRFLLVRLVNDAERGSRVEVS